MFFPPCVRTLPGVKCCVPICVGRVKHGRVQVKFPRGDDKVCMFPSDVGAKNKGFGN